MNTNKKEKVKTVAEKYDLLDEGKKSKYVLVIDEGTTSSRAAVFDKSATLFDIFSPPNNLVFL